MNLSSSVTKLLLLWIATLATTPKKSSKFAVLANAAPTCPTKDAGCTENLDDCLKLIDDGCKQINVMESCPLQFSCGDDNKDNESKNDDCETIDRKSSCKGSPGCSWIVTKKRKKTSEKCIESPNQKECSKIKFPKKKKKAMMSREKTNQEKKKIKKKRKKCEQKGCDWNEESFSCLTRLTKKNDFKNDISKATPCSERSSCFDCLHGNKEERDGDFCVYVPETGGCHDSCNSMDVPMDTSCFTGMMSKKEATDTCASIVQDQKNAESCQSKSQLNCEECTSTTFNVLKPDGTIKEGGTCQWFKVPDDEFTIGGSGGYCASECNFNGCGATTCDIEKPDDLDRINKELCGSKTKCSSCTGTKIKTIDGASTCKWFPPKDDDVDNDECAENGFCSHECIDGDCGVTGECALPESGTVFVKYFNSKFLLNQYVADKAKIELLNLYPGLNIEIFEEGSPVTQDYRYNRVRIFVEKKKDKKVELCKRYIIAAPYVG